MAVKRIKSIAFLVGMAVCCVLSGCSEPDRLECNYGASDITPDEPVLLAGFAARKGLSDSVHRPLNTHCFVLQKDTVRVCIITNDMMEMPPAFANELRGMISEGTGIPRGNIFIHCTHTHSAPRVSGSSAEQGGTNYAYVHKVMRTIVDNAVVTANDAGGFLPFTIEAGTGECTMNCNRCEKGLPCDHEVCAARLLDRRGRTVVSLVNYACHPVSLNHRSLAVSPDFPGITADALSEAWGGGVMYFSGAAGNINPCGAIGSDILYTESMGMELAEAAKNITFTKIRTGNTLTVFNNDVELPFRASEITEDVIEAHVAEIIRWNVSATWKSDVEGWRELILSRIAAGEVKNHLPFETGAVNIGGLVLFFSQGEPFNEYQSALRKHFPGVPLLFAAYTNGQNSYLPDSRAYLSGACEYEKEQMHIYIKAPYPLSDRMPGIYEAACRETVERTLAGQTDKTVRQ